MTYPPQQPDPYGPGDPSGQPGSYGPPDPYGQPASAPHGQQHYGWQQPGTGYSQQVPPGPPPGVAPGYGGWEQQQYGGPNPGQPYGGQPGAFGHPGGYPQPPGGSTRRRSRLPWILAGGGLAAIVVVAILVLVTGGGGTAGSPRDTAQAYADAVNDRKPDRTIFCESFLGQYGGGTDLPNLPTDLPDLPELLEIKMSASVGEVSQDGDSASAAVSVVTEFAGQKATATHKLTIKHEAGGWKICDIDFGLPRLGG